MTADQARAIVFAVLSGSLLVAFAVLLALAKWLVRVRDGEALLVCVLAVASSMVSLAFAVVSLENLS